MRGSTAGLPDTFDGNLDAYRLLLAVLDVTFSAIIVTPAVVAYWRSVWELMGYYVWPQKLHISALISTIIGLIGNILFIFIQNQLQQQLNPDRKRLIYYVLSRLYTTIFAFVCVNGWRGPWILLDVYTKNDTMTIMAITIISGVALMVMRALRNVSAPPFAVVPDRQNGYFEVLTMFRVVKNENLSLYILDCLFSVLIVGTLVVFVWRGAWALLDIFLFPTNEKLSAWSSLIIGYAAVVIAFLLQPPMKWICDRIEGNYRLIVADIFLIFSLIGTINVWRGIWNLLNLYLIPDNLELSCWITHWVCLIILILLGCSNSLLVRGVYIDAEEPAGKCVVFPCYYLRLIFQEERAKKALKQKNNPIIECKETINHHINEDIVNQTKEI